MSSKFKFRFSSKLFSWRNLLLDPSPKIFGFALIIRSRRHFCSLSCRYSKLFYFPFINNEKNDIEIWYVLKNQKRRTKRREKKMIKRYWELFRVRFSSALDIRRAALCGVKKCWFTSFSSSNFNRFFVIDEFKWVIKAVEAHSRSIQLPVSIAQKTELRHSQLINLDGSRGKNEPSLISFIRKIYENDLKRKRWIWILVPASHLN